MRARCFIVRVCLRRAQDGDTPLHYAARNGHFEVSSLLLERGAAVNATKVRYAVLLQPCGAPRLGFGGAACATAAARQSRHLPPAMGTLRHGRASPMLAVTNMAPCCAVMRRCALPRAAKA